MENPLTQQEVDLLVEYDTKLDQLATRKRFNEALPIVEEALKIYPNNITIKLWYAHIFCQLNHHTCDKKLAKRIEQNYVDVLELIFEGTNYTRVSDTANDMANFFKQQNDYQRAIGYYLMAIYYYKYKTNISHLSNFHFNMSDAFFKLGDNENGLLNYQFLHINRQDYERETLLPYWDLKPHKDETIVVHNEQAFGDLVMFSRFIKYLKNYFRGVIMEVPKRFKYMFQISPYYKDIKVVTREDNVIDALGAQYHLNYDQLNYCYHKLNGYFGDPKNITYLLESIPYLEPAPDDLAKWNHLSEESKNNKTISIAINWCGKVTNPLEYERKIPLDAFKTLNELPFLRIYLIQKEQGLDQSEVVNGWKYPENVINLSNEIDVENGFQDTMAIIKQMDVFVSSDTGIIHVAGALDHPTWALVNYNSEWRFGTPTNKKCMWYKSVDIYRQHEYHSWTGVFQEVKRGLIDLYNSKYNLTYDSMK